MLFSSPLAGPLHVAKSAIDCIIAGKTAYPKTTPYWTRPAGNVDPAVTQFFGPSLERAEPVFTWPGGEGVPAGTYTDFHKGTDFGTSRCGAPVLAAAAGKVIQAGTDVDGAIYVKIDHGQGFQTWYWHLSTRRVSAGATVAEGQQVGNVGSTGNSTACHLHWHVLKNGLPVDGYKRLKVNTSVDPDAVATPEAEMVFTKNLIDYHVTIGAGWNVRSGPTTVDKIIRTTASPESWSILGVVKGALANGSDQWYVRLNGLVLEFAHSGAITAGPTAPAPPVTDCAPAVAAATAPLQAQIAALNTKISAAKTALG